MVALLGVIAMETKVTVDALALALALLPLSPPQAQSPSKATKSAK